MKSKVLKGIFGDREELPADRAQQGGIDFYYLALVLLMLVFGTLMSYSASAVYGEQFYGDSFYFLKRYVNFC